MAKITTIPGRDPNDDSTCYEGTRIELRECSVTIRPASARTIYEVVYQFMEWGTECLEEAGRLTKLRQAAGDVAQEAIDKNWFDAADGEELWDKLTNLWDMWESRAAQLREKAEAYDDAWTYLATLLDEQDVEESTPLANARQALRRLLEATNMHIDSDDDSLRAYWNGVLQALTVFDRATKSNWGLYDGQHVDTDRYFC